MFLWENFADLEFWPYIQRAVADLYEGVLEGLMLTHPTTILHELVHYISYLKRKEFREITGCRRAQRRIDAFPFDYSCIDDCKAIDFLVKKSAKDREIVDWFKETRRTRRGKKVTDGTAYGIEKVEQLAKLEDRACASLLNADSYVVFVATSCVEFLEEKYAGRPLPDRDVLLSRKPCLGDQPDSEETIRIMLSKI